MSLIEALSVIVLFYCLAEVQPSARHMRLICFVSPIKILNSRWVSSSRDVVALRQTLLNPSLAAEFTAFVAMKGDTLESNVQFWLEVQKFKVRLAYVSSKRFHLLVDKNGYSLVYSRNAGKVPRAFTINPLNLTSD